MNAGWPTALAIVVTTVVAMEVVAAGVHRYVMHGFGWTWHKSHHEPHDSRLERNDLYAAVFALISIALFTAGSRWPALWWVGAGTVVYGLLYALLHDGLVHRRFPFVRPPRNGYLKRLVQAHRLHHAVKGKEGCVSFGFLYAPPLPLLLQELRSGRRKP